VPITLTRAITVLPSLTGVPRDRHMFGLHFLTSDTPSAADRTALATTLQEFINVAHNGAGSAISGFLGHSVSRGTDAAEVNLYEKTDLAGSADFGSPTLETRFTLGPVVPATTPLPEECAVVVAYHGDLTGVAEESGLTRPKARRRGRIYLGPLSNVAGSVEAGTNRLRVLSGFMTNLAAAMAFLDTDLAPTPYIWSVYSPTAGATYPVVGGWIDDAFDTQRRRGLSPISRTTFTV
jgi:hypothetical protein